MRTGLEAIRVLYLKQRNQRGEDAMSQRDVEAEEGRTRFIINPSLQGEDWERKEAMPTHRVDLYTRSHGCYPSFPPS